MYQCVGCGGDVENINGQCFCGKTSTNHKGKVEGENYVANESKTSGQKIVEKSKVRTCPHCGWTGLVVPRINHGCPEHGIWYKSQGVKNITQNEEENDDRDSERRDASDSNRDNPRKKRRNHKDR